MSVTSYPAGFLLFAVLLAAPAAASPLQQGFDFSKSELDIPVALRGKPLNAIVDTGVDPSVIDLNTAEALGLKIDRKDGGEADGFGQGKGATIFPTQIAGLTIQNHLYPAFDATASDMTALSAHYGRKLDAVLGYSFLSDKIVLIDYADRTLGLLDQAYQAMPMVRTCQARWSVPLTTVDSFPVIPGFHFGTAVGPVTLDSGSNGGIGLYQAALDLPGLRAALVHKGTAIHSGARGDAKDRTYTLAASVGFGPFTLPAGQFVIVHDEHGSVATRVANIGNALFAELKIRILLDYPGRLITFYGNCR